MQSSYDVIFKDETIAVSHNPDVEISFSDYDDPVDGILSSENAYK